LPPLQASYHLHPLPPHLLLLFLITPFSPLLLLFSTVVASEAAAAALSSTSTDDDAKSSRLNIPRQTSMFRRTATQVPKAKPPSTPATTKYVLAPAMDVFSLGCIIAEVFLDGKALLDFPTMLRYVSSPLESLAPPSAGQSDGEGEKGDGSKGEKEQAGDSLASVHALLLRIKVGINPMEVLSDTCTLLYI
jgi:hypothetical protein